MSKPFKSGISFSTARRLSQAYTCFSKPDMRGLVSPGQIPRVGMSDVWGVLSPQLEVMYPWDPSWLWVRSPHYKDGESGNGRNHVSASRTCFNVARLSSVVQEYIQEFSGIFQREFSTCTCRFVASIGGGEFRTFPHCHLKPFCNWFYL